jgi:hypothetical protein
LTRWQLDKAVTDAYLPTVQAIAGTQFMVEAPYEDDAKRNTDLIVLQSGGIRLAVRLRSQQYWHRYPGEFTIRYSRPMGTLTEFDKIIDGWGDYFFYGFRHRNPPRLIAWGILDLTAFRNFAKEHRDKHGKWPGCEKGNRDQSSSFLAFQWSEIPLGAIIASWPDRVAGAVKLFSENKRRAVQMRLLMTPPQQNGCGRKL